MNKMGQQLIISSSYVPIINNELAKQVIQSEIDPGFVYHVFSQTFFWVAGILSTAAALKFLKHNRTQNRTSKSFPDPKLLLWPINDDGMPPNNTNNLASGNSDIEKGFQEMMPIMLEIQDYVRKYVPDPNGHFDEIADHELVYRIDRMKHIYDQKISDSLLTESQMDNKSLMTQYTKTKSGLDWYFKNADYTQHMGNLCGVKTYDVSKCLNAINDFISELNKFTDLQ